MKTSCTCLLLTTFTMALVINSLAMLPEAGAVEIISADQCDQTTFKACAKNFFDHFGQDLPIRDEVGFLNNLANYIVNHQVDGVKQLCKWLEDFRQCISLDCWTGDTFNTILTTQDGAFFAAGFATADNLCTTNALNLVIADALPCVYSFLATYHQLLDCINKLGINNINNILNFKCTDIATALNCLVNTLASQPTCPPDLDLALCQSAVFGGKRLRPDCSKELDGACVITTTAPPQTTPANQQSTTTSQPTGPTTQGQTNPTPTPKSASSVAPTTLLLLVVSAIRAII